MRPGHGHGRALGRVRGAVALGVGALRGLSERPTASLPSLLGVHGAGDMETKTAFEALVSYQERQRRANVSHSVRL